ncbi:MAG: electron transfer flavoprotein subunit alpha/FixB family protein [Chloroflexi bacterium]|nr:electron transfer flavoprotein subunit alpha/FixB family protein [Chloroflexota bacterium]
MAEGVLVIGEIAEGKLVAVTQEMIAAATRIIGEVGGLVNVALFGSEAETLAQSAIESGGDLVYTFAEKDLDEYLTDTWAPAVEMAVQVADPAVVLLGQTSVGRDLAPRLAFRLNTAVVMDVSEFSVESGTIHWTRPVYGGNARAVVSVVTSPQIVTVRAKSFDPLEPEAGRTGDTIPMESGIDLAQVKERLVGKEIAEAEGVKLEDAAIVVSGGRGLGGPEGFKPLEELAGTLGAAVGASRAACDLGWYPPSQQVGLTGKTVSPDLYIAVAISGASQHWAGMANSKNIVAINKDPDATMVKSARYAIIEDYKNVVPALNTEIKKLKG